MGHSDSSKKISIIIASCNRYRLLKQTIASLRKNSYYNSEIIVVDCSTDDNSLRFLKNLRKIAKVYTFKGVIGPWHSKQFGSYLASDLEFIYFSDNDVYFLPKWDYLLVKGLRKFKDIILIGGRGMRRQHGYFQPRKLNKDYEIGLENLQPGYSMMMRKKDWKKYGHFPDYDGDSWLGYQLRGSTKKNIGVIDPPVIIHCGLTSTFRSAEPIIDYDNMQEDIKKYKNILFE